MRCREQALGTQPPRCWLYHKRFPASRPLKPAVPWGRRHKGLKDLDARLQQRPSGTLPASPTAFFPLPSAKALLYLLCLLPPRVWGNHLLHVADPDWPQKAPGTAPILLSQQRSKAPCSSPAAMAPWAAAHGAAAETSAGVPCSRQSCRPGFQKPLHQGV